MAVIKLRSSSNANRLINYCERKAEERDGVNCDPEYVREQMKWTREEWEKTDGVQAHHVIQSFNPEDNITAREANELGRRLAEQIAPGHEVAVYTHTDREHIHNHLVINSVSFEDGHKYHSDKEQLYNIREKSDELCREKGLDIIREPYAQERFSQAEYKLVERGERLWKDELRTAIDDAKQHTKSLDDMKSYLKDRYNIEMKIQNQNVSFLHPEKEKYVRGKTLGESYTKGAIEHEHGRQREGAAATRDRGFGTDRILFGGNIGASKENPEFSRGLGDQVRQGFGEDRQSDRAIVGERSRTKEITHGRQTSLNRDGQESTRAESTSGHSRYQEGAGVGKRLERGAPAQGRPGERLHEHQSEKQGAAQSHALQVGHNRGLERSGWPNHLPGTQSDNKELSVFDSLRKLGQETERAQNLARHQTKRKQMRHKSRAQQQRQQGPDLER
ncbi:relaxase/mobilization nuclease domain-containing protein [Alicyclobacillus fastidiosus]|uniref:relaxase/mobilization nuclease domain-containing protein n=1 Tax=Alicyclobacillus fastidiosus TaxID=392011 RepID=UPI0024E1498C|nr:relaxase/mobilization nuclease domain-containing protein [Alicyclobacillus fastidiosus]